MPRDFPLMKHWRPEPTTERERKAKTEKRKR